MTAEIAAEVIVTLAGVGRHELQAMISSKRMKQKLWHRCTELPGEATQNIPKCFAKDLRQSAALAIAAHEDAETKGVCQSFNIFQLAFRVIVYQRLRMKVSKAEPWTNPEVLPPVLGSSPEEPQAGDD